ncbi:hypothetical protein P1J78_03575 [Psychromarinibacter sp. C21-152]|uniref:DUF2029 domain-containing protein n=1 Tax=Psychromarinibacter sediminicola TaxID=3033385 RepID=A0AAE3NRV0_9RHOB|nr:hypothetical protein [Psychromarinibacter sediminicola]MDF0599805.1 hypothetical protein [Psychromarinibacter sediminicola]
MSRPNPAIYITFLIAVIVILGAVTLAKGGFYIAKHEGDTLHLLQIVFRMASGEWPHMDFMTPIGLLAFAPIVLFLNLGVGVGMSILLSQVLVAFILLPAVFWTGMSRLPRRAAYPFGFAVIVLVLGLVHGEAERSVSISMHYNRWAWAVSYVVIALAVLPPRAFGNDLLDGLIIGLGLAFLALCKVTYFAAFAPVVVVGLIANGNARALRSAILSGLGVALLVSVFATLDFWFAYVADLRTVAASSVRPQPGLGLESVVTAPAYLGATAVLIAGIILLRQAGEMVLGLSLLLLAPGFVYVTYQNFGNDPQWLMLLAVLLLVPEPRAELRNGFGWPVGQALGVAAAVAIAFAAPSVLNLAYSPFRHLSLPEDDYEPILARNPEHHDLQARVIRANRVDGLVALDVPGSGLEDRAGPAERDEQRVLFQDRALPFCELQMGIVAWFEAIVADLEANGFGDGTRVFVADLFMGHWMFGNLSRLEGGAPWYYGGLPGIDSADYLLVPLCPTSQSVRKQILEAVKEAEIPVREVRRAPLYVLYGLGEAAG